MAPPRSYDREELIRILKANPDWTRHQIAAHLTKFNADHGRPDVAVKAAVVGKAIYHLRSEFEDLGIIYNHSVPERGLCNDLKRNTGRAIGADFHLTVIMKRLRQVDRLRQGEEVRPEDEARWALNWEHKLHVERRVVDIDDFGKPYIREALRHELDENGQLIDIVAQPLPLAPGESARLLEAEKAVARHKAEAEALQAQLTALQRRVTQRPPKRRRRTG